MLARTLASTALGTALAIVGGVARAEPSKTDSATAQALFYEARALMKENKLQKACPKLEQSLRLDYGIGTEFNLADCHEKLGKLATAWHGFTSVAAAAKAAGQPERERVALRRARALEPRLPKVAITVPAPAPGTEVRRDEALVPSAAPVPVDPGAHEIVATAPGRQPWRTTVTAAEGKLTAVTVPALVPVLVAETTLTSASGPVGAEAPAPPATSAYPEAHEDRTNAQRTAGFVLGGAGLASLAVGAGFGIASLVAHAQSKDHCLGDLCDADGVADRDRAITRGNVATATSLAGGGALLAGILLVVTAPKDRPSTVGSWRAAPTLAQNGGGVAITGVLP